MNDDREVLLVEDDQVDVMTVQRAFETAEIANPLRVIGNGADALDYLRNACTPRGRPGLILLDLNLPLMNGIEFLETIKADEDLKRIPVVIVSTSNWGGDIQSCYERGAAGYFVKPADFRSYVELVETTTRYWTLSA